MSSIAPLFVVQSSGLGHYPELMKDPNEKDSRTSSLVAFLTVLVGFSVLASFMVAPYLLAIVMGGILALLATPFHRRLLKRGMRKRISALLLTLVIVFLVVGPILTFAALAIRQGVAVAQYMAEADVLSLETVVNRLSHWEPLARLFENRNIEGQLKTAIGTIGKGASVAILSVAKSIPEGILQLALGCLTCYFMLVDGARFVRWSYGRIPLSKEVRLRLNLVFRETAISVVWASMTAAFTQAILMLTAFLILKVPAAFLAGGVTFVFAFVPFAGSVPVWTAGALFLFFTGSPIKAVIMIIFGLFTSTIDNFIRPWVLKGRSEMHPLISLIAILGGIQMFGLFGVFIGPILAAVVISLLQIWPFIGSRYGMEFDLAQPTEQPGKSR